MAGMTTVLYRSLRLDGVMPAIVLPRTLSLATMAIPLLRFFTLVETNQPSGENRNDKAPGALAVRD